MTAGIPQRYAPIVYGVIQAAITSAVATTIATLQAGRAGLAEFVWYWIGCWTMSWLLMLPVVVFISPLIQRAVLVLTAARQDAVDPPKSAHERSSR